jgi:hypothetical protein
MSPLLDATGVIVISSLYRVPSLRRLVISPRHTLPDEQILDVEKCFVKSLIYRQDSYHYAG